MAKDIEAPPFPHETMQALRSMGYTFSQAVADIVDNSIDAGAARIQILVHASEEDPADSYVAIMDDGIGMSENKLISAMKLGSTNASRGDLGKFGMGMKTASLSQCDRMVVASVTKSGFSAYSWDMDVLKRKNSWLLTSVRTGELPAPVVEYLNKCNTGTVVLWQRLRSGLNKTPKSARNVLDREMLDAMDYLKTVFHRHLPSGSSRSRIKISMNEHEFGAWDPYCCNEKKARELKSMTFKVEGASGIIGSVTLRPVLLPSQDQFSTGTAFAEASGYLKWNDMQGLYFYRNNRLVSFGGWDRLRSKDEKTKYLRVAVEYTPSPEMDNEMDINVSKQHAALPRSIRPEIEKALSPLFKLARENYSSAREHNSDFKAKKYSMVDVQKLLIKKCMTKGEVSLVNRLFRDVEKSL